MNSDDFDNTMRGEPDGARRGVLQRMGFGLVAAPLLMAGNGASAQQPQPASPSSARRLTDPREKYPKPLFAPQQQERPGLAARMNPPPDHGESSYVGFGRLAGRKALITGATPASGGQPPSPMHAKAPTSPLAICRRKKRTRPRWCD